MGEFVYLGALQPDIESLALLESVASFVGAQHALAHIRNDRLYRKAVRGIRQSEDHIAELEGKIAEAQQKAGQAAMSWYESWRGQQKERGGADHTLTEQQKAEMLQMC